MKKLIKLNKKKKKRKKRKRKQACHDGKYACNQHLAPPPFIKGNNNKKNFKKRSFSMICLHLTTLLPSYFELIFPSLFFSLCYHITFHEKKKYIICGNDELIIIIIIIQT